MLGRSRGREEGLQQGLLDGQLKIAQQMLAEGFAVDMIVRLTGLSQEELDGLKAGIE
ncbi:hypothetical protein [Streptococcus suis]|uniref:hypothetical protein n=1 Tax=Streptococcus suis TaxID=1307 RepID=UPI001379AF24|nr:hypothetical protein [Streptococcus suis]